jgi:hypothetical protein
VVYRGREGKLWPHNVKESASKQVLDSSVHKLADGADNGSVGESAKVLANLLNNHEDGELDCPKCEEQFGQCSCGGVVHAEYQEIFERVPNSKAMISRAILVLECDRCDDCEVE